MDDSERKDLQPRGAYSKIARQIWSDAAFVGLSRPAANAQTLYMRLISAPETWSTPGLLPISRGGLADQLEWDLSDFNRCWKEIEDAGLGVADWKAQVVFIPQAFLDDPPWNPNMVRGWKKLWKRLPECGPKAAARDFFSEYFRAAGENWLCAFEEVLAVDATPEVARRNPSGNPFGKGSANPFGKGPGNSLLPLIPNSQKREPAREEPPGANAHVDVERAAVSLSTPSASVPDRSAEPARAAPTFAPTSRSRSDSTTGTSTRPIAPWRPHVVAPATAAATTDLHPIIADEWCVIAAEVTGAPTVIPPSSIGIHNVLARELEVLENWPERRRAAMKAFWSHPTQTKALRWFVQDYDIWKRRAAIYRERTDQEIAEKIAATEAKLEAENAQRIDPETFERMKAAHFARLGWNRSDEKPAGATG